MSCILEHLISFDRVQASQRKLSFWLSLLRSFIRWLAAGAWVVTEGPEQDFLHLFPNLAAIRSCFRQSPKEPSLVPFVHFSFWAFTPSCIFLKFRHSELGFSRPCIQEHITASSDDLARQSLKAFAKVSRVSLQDDTRVELIGVASFPSSQLSPALAEQFASFS